MIEEVVVVAIMILFTAVTFAWPSRDRKRFS